VKEALVPAATAVVRRRCLDRRALLGPSFVISECSEDRPPTEVAGQPAVPSEYNADDGTRTVLLGFRAPGCARSGCLPSHLVPWGNSKTGTIPMPAVDNM
jgi:hypothetical protein